MINNTMEKLNSLKLFGMAAELERQLATPAANDLPFEHRVRSMVDHETTMRENKRLQVLLKKARLPDNSCISSPVEAHHAPFRQYAWALLSMSGQSSGATRPERSLPRRCVILIKSRAYSWNWPR